MRASKPKAALIILCLILTLVVKSQTNFIWGKQFGSSQEEYCLNHVTDQDGNIYICGKTLGTMDSQNAGMNDGFIMKIDSLANTVWTRQFGTPEEEDILWSAIDENGNVYITGSTRGALQGKNHGKEDLFVAKYMPDGKMEWVKQFGTDSSDFGSGIYADQMGSVYITGTTSGTLGKSSSGKSDGFIMKLNNAGEELFTCQFGTTGDDNGISITGDGRSCVYVCGTTWGDIACKNKGFVDAFYGIVSDEGDVIKFNQFGTEGFDMALQLIIDEEMNIYVGGSTSGNLGSEQLGEGDCFLTKFSPRGEIEWTNQFGTTNHDGIRGIDFSKKSSNNILVSGILNLAPAKAFIRMYDKGGSLLWERIFTAKGWLGTSGKDVSMDDKGNIYHLGLTGGNLFGTLNGGSDVYLVKIGLDRCFRNP